MRLKTIVCVLLFPHFCSAIAETPSANYLKNFEISIGIGQSWVASKNSTMQISQTELDEVTINRVSSNAFYKMGVGYHLFSDQLSQRKFLNDLLIEANFYHAKGAITGNVSQFGHSAYENYSFHAPFVSDRLMIDLKPSLFTAYDISPYPIVGVGVASNRSSYDETANSSAGAASNSALNFDSNSSRHISYDAGAGIRYQMKKHLISSLEYVYNYTGNMSSSAGISTVSPPNFATKSQNVLFNIAWRF